MPVSYTHLVTRLNYLLNQEDNMKGLVIRLLNHLSEYGCPEEELASVSARMNLSQMTILSEKSLYKRRKTKADFTEQLKDEEESEELSMEEVLNLNKVRNRYSQKAVSYTHLDVYKRQACILRRPILVGP